MTTMATIIQNKAFFMGQIHINISILVRPIGFEPTTSSSARMRSNPAELRAPTISKYGGEGGIRTHDTVADMALFKSATFNHSVTSPGINLGFPRLIYYS